METVFRKMEKKMDKALLNVAEFCEYTGLGQTKARSLLNDPQSTFTVRIGNRLYANKKLLDEWLDRVAKLNLRVI